MTKKRRIFFQTQEVIQKTRRGYVDLDMDYFQFYNAAFEHVASLSSNCSKDFILWVMGKVDEENRFQYSKELLNEFNEALSKIAKPKHYAESTMNAALRELSESSIVIRSSRGEYTVNPKLFWSDEIAHRIKSVQSMEQEVRRLPERDAILYPVFTDEELANLEPIHEQTKNEYGLNNETSTLESDDPGGDSYPRGYAQGGGSGGGPSVD
jgi:hypothetical protein